MALDLRFGVALSRVRVLDSREFYAEKRNALAEAESLLESITALVEKALPDAFLDAFSSDADQLAYVAARIGDVYRAALEWALRWVHTRCSWSEAGPLLELLPQLMKNLPTEVAQISESIDQALEGAVEARRRSGAAPVREVTLKFTIPADVHAAVLSELRRLATLRPDLVLAMDADDDPSPKT